MKGFHLQWDAEKKIEYLDKLDNASYWIFGMPYILFRDKLPFRDLFDHYFGTTGFWANLDELIIPLILIAIEQAITNRIRKKLATDLPAKPPEES